MSCCLLWEIVAEGGPPHIVGAVRSSIRIQGAARAGPKGAVSPAVLNALAQATLGSTVKVVPVSSGKFLDVFVLVSAVSRSTGQKPRPTVHGSAAGHRLGIAAGHVGRRRAVAFLAEEVTEDVVSTVVGIDHQTRRRIYLYSAEGREVVQQSELTIGTKSGISDRRGAVAAGAVSVQPFQSERELLIKNCDPAAGADGAADRAVVIGADRIASEGSGPGWWSGGCVRVNAITEEAGDAEDFIVAVVSLTRFPYCLGDDIGSDVEGVVGVDVVKAAVISSRTDHFVQRQATAGGVQRFGILRRSTQPERVREELLGYPEGVLPRPHEAGFVLRVDGGRKDFRAVILARSVFGRERPHLASGKGPAVAQSGLRPELALANDIAVRLVVIRGNASAQPVHFVIAGHRHVVQLAGGLQRETGLTA